MNPNPSPNPNPNPNPNPSPNPYPNPNPNPNQVLDSLKQFAPLPADIAPFQARDMYHIIRRVIGFEGLPLLRIVYYTSRPSRYVRMCMPCACTCTPRLSRWPRTGITLASITLTLTPRPARWPRTGERSSWRRSCNSPSRTPLCGIRNLTLGLG